jgi:hypothetical protein
MTDEYDDIARRLREEGQAVAPPDLLPTVMAEVRAEPRTPARRRSSWPRWQPLAAWTAGAAALVALGFGLAHLPHSTSSSSSSGSLSRSPLATSEAVHAGGTKVPAALGSNAYTLPAAVARHILGKYYPPDTPLGMKLDGITTYRVEVPAAAYSYYAAKLRRAQARALGQPASPSAGNPVIIRLFRAHHSAAP